MIPTSTLNLAAVALGLSVAVPVASKLVTHVHAPGWLKSGIAVGLTAAGSLAAWLAKVPGVTTWRALGVAAAGAMAAASLQRWSWLEPFLLQLEKRFPGWLGQKLPVPSAPPAPSPLTPAAPTAGTPTSSTPPRPA